MSESPGDLAVAFRSFGRRLNEAMGPADGRSRPWPMPARPRPASCRSELMAVITAAAQEVEGVTVDGDVQRTGAAVADAIAATPPDAWDDGRLERLRALALDGGRPAARHRHAVARRRPSDCTAGVVLSSASHAQTARCSLGPA